MYIHVCVCFVCWFHSVMRLVPGWTRSISLIPTTTMRQSTEPARLVDHWSSGPLLRLVTHMHCYNNPASYRTRMLYVTLHVYNWLCWSHSFTLYSPLSLSLSLSLSFSPPLPPSFPSFVPSFLLSPFSLSLFLPISLITYSSTMLTCWTGLTHCVVSSRL